METEFAEKYFLIVKATEEENRDTIIFLALLV